VTATGGTLREMIPDWTLGEGAKRDCLADTLPAACPNDDLARKHALQFDLPLFGQDT